MSKKNKDNATDLRRAEALGQALNDAMDESATLTPEKIKLFNEEIQTMQRAQLCVNDAQVVQSLSAQRVADARLKNTPVQRSVLGPGSQRIQ